VLLAVRHVKVDVKRVVGCVTQQKVYGVSLIEDLLAGHEVLGWSDDAQIVDQPTPGIHSI
jgi:hypothetical protein